MAHRPSQSSAWAASQLGNTSSWPSRRRTRAFDRYLAAVETELACRLSPAMTAPAVLSAVAPAAQLRRVTLHHIGQRRDPGGHAETLEARADIPPGLYDA